MVDLVTNLGGPAGFGENSVSRNDDGSSPLIDLSSLFPGGLNFFGENFSSVFVNTNGNVTLDNPLATFTPFGITGESVPGFFPFFADVDTREAFDGSGPEDLGGFEIRTGDEAFPVSLNAIDPGAGTSQGTNLIYYDLDTDNRIFTATWDDVGFFPTNTTNTNAFQVQLVDQSAEFEDGDFDIIFNYEDINWTTGGASGGDGNGLGGTVARVGYTAGTGEPGTFFEFPESGFQSEILDLENRSNVGVPGQFIFPVRNGLVANVVTIESSGPVQEGNDGDRTDIIFTVSRTLDTGDQTFQYTITGFGDDPADDADVEESIPAELGFVTIEDGETSATFTVTVIGDTIVEETETFIVTLDDTVLDGAPSVDPEPDPFPDPDGAPEPNVVFGNRQAIGTIINDDGLPPPPPIGFEADIFGDPHLVTLDGLGYSFQSAGEYILARATSGDALEIQVRTQPVGDLVTVNTAMATRVGTSTVSIDARADQPLIVNGVPTDIPEGSTNISTGGGQVFLIDNVYTIVYPNGEQVKVTVFDSDRLDVCLVLDGGRASGSFEGLLGNLDGNPTNDLQVVGDPSPLSLPVDFDVLYNDFADSWRITNDTSLFTYGPGQDTNTFQLLDFPPQEVTVDDLPDDLVSAAEALLDQQGVTDPIIREQTIVDLVLTGDPSFAEGATNLAAEPTEMAPELDNAPDPVPLIGVSATSTSQPEGDAGSTLFTFEVFRSGSTAGVLDGTFTVAGSGANPANAADFGGALPSGVFSFADGDETETISVLVSGDTVAETDERFTVTINTTDPSALVAAPTASSIIRNDDATPLPVIGFTVDVPDAEGTGADSTVEIEVIRSGSTLEASSVDVVIGPGSGDSADSDDFAEGEDMVTVAFMPGETNKLVTFDIVGDSTPEPDESFEVTLTNVSGATLDPDASVFEGVIVNDDGDAPVVSVPMGLEEFPAVFELSDLDGGNGFVINGVNEGDQAGFAVSGAGDINNDGFQDIIVGARFADGGATDSGVTYVVFGGLGFGADGSVDLSTLDGSNGFALNGVGNGVDGSALTGGFLDVSSLGDVNGDGIDDLIIGADEVDIDGRVDTGQSYVVFGSSTGFSAELALSSLNGSNGFTLDGLGFGTVFGSSVSGVGDINDDGVNDFIIGSFGANANGRNDSGESYVVFGGSGLGSTGSFNPRDLNGGNGFQIEGIDIADRSGRSVSGAGDVNGDGIDDLIIGATFGDPGGRLLAGESYVVFGSSTGFQGDLELSSLDGRNGFQLNGIGAGDASARSVSSAGDVNGDGIDDLIVAGERADGPGANDRGESYVVFGSTQFGSTGAAAELEFSELDGTNGFILTGVDGGDFTGRSVSSAGDLNKDGFGDLIIGAVGADPDGRPQAGQSYVVFGSSDLGASGSQSLGDLDGDNGFIVNGVMPNDLSGGSVAGTGDVNGDGVDDLIIGAYLADVDGAVDAGEAYVIFGVAATGPTTEITSAVGDVSSGEAFEVTVTFSDDVTGFDASDLIVSGGSVSGPVTEVDARTYTALIDPSGRGVLSVDVGSGAATDSGGLDNQAAAAFLIDVAGLNLDDLDGANGIMITGANAGDESGFTVSGAGDINDDGFQDLLIGARKADGGATDSGVTYVVFGGSGLGTTIDLSGIDGTNGFALNGIGAGDGHRLDVSNLGDINDDGIDDLIIGADLADVDGRTDTGQSYVVFGSSDGFDSELDLSSLDGTNGFTMDGLGFGTFFGTSVSGAGDINDDGVNDLIVGSFGANANGLNDSGESYVVFGGSGLGASGSFDPRDLNGANGFQIEGIDIADRSGRSVSWAGDVNGDTIDDLVIGAVFGDPDGRLLAGESYVVFGSSESFRGDLELSELDGTNGFTINGIDAGDASGREVSGAGDVNGDGIGDLIISAERGDRTGDDNAGESYVLFGTSNPDATVELSSLDGTNGFILGGIEAGDFAGRVVASAGDINQDGFDDIIVGAVRANPDGRTNAGQSYVIFGASDVGASGTWSLGDLDGADGFFVNGITPNDLSGGAADGTGDVNGDGFDDLIIGAYLADPNGRNGAGESYVVFGSDMPGRVVAGDDSAEALTGTAGNDALRGAGGNDTLTGGDGDDTFVLDVQFGDDVIVDFDQAGDDVINARTTGDSFDTFDVNADDTVDATDVGLTDRLSLENGATALSLTFADGSTLLLENTIALQEDDFAF
ncbi:MAG: nidogen-like domain-containing protein [Alphaproteobacteria bacterium]